MGRLLVAIAVALGAMVSPAPADTHDIDVINYLFHDDVFTARPGQQVTWRWANGGHTVTALDGSFDSGLRDAGATYTSAFEGGTVSYRCTIHSRIDLDTGRCHGMCGVITEPFRDAIPPQAEVLEPQDGEIVVAFPKTANGRLSHEVRVRGVVSDDTEVSAISLRVSNPVWSRDFSVSCIGCGTTHASWERVVDLVPGMYRAQVIAADRSANVGRSQPVTFVVV